MNCSVFLLLGLSGKMSNKETVGALPCDFTLKLIYLRETQLKDTLPDKEELDTATLAALNCQQVLRHEHTHRHTEQPGHSKARLPLCFDRGRRVFSQIPQEQKHKLRGRR